MIYLNQLNLRKKLSEYDFFISDVYGVIHDGVELIDGVSNTFEYIQNILKKETILLSNAPRRSEFTKTKLQTFGFFNNFNTDIITSGEVFYNDTLNGKYQGKYFFIGKIEDLDIIKNIPSCHHVNQIADADFIIISGTFPNIVFDTNIIDEIIHSNKKIVCINPDLIVFTGGRRVYCAGMIAKIIEAGNVDVDFYGKPHSRVYNYLFNKIQHIDKRRILIIGDSMITDIYGANAQGIDSLLTMTGIHNQQFKNGKTIEEMSHLYNAKPTFYTDSFSIDY